MCYTVNNEIQDDLAWIVFLLELHDIRLLEEIE